VALKLHSLRASSATGCESIYNSISSSRSEEGAIHCPRRRRRQLQWPFASMVRSEALSGRTVGTFRSCRLGVASIGALPTRSALGKRCHPLFCRGRALAIRTADCWRWSFGGGSEVWLATWTRADGYLAARSVQKKGAIHCPRWRGDSDCGSGLLARSARRRLERRVVGTFRFGHLSLRGRAFASIEASLMCRALGIRCHPLFCRRCALAIRTVDCWRWSFGGGSEVWLAPWTRADRHLAATPDQKVDVTFGSAHTLGNA